MSGIRFINAGAPHFSSLAKHNRQSNYTIERVIHESIDNIIGNCNKLYINTKISSSNRLTEISISDDNPDGFTNINETSVSNPLNMGHKSNHHDDDDFHNEHGTGMKAAALACSDKLEVYSSVPSLNEKYLITADFEKMINEPDINASYNPEIRSILTDEYNRNHPFLCGSTIKMSSIRDSICGKTNQKDITKQFLDDFSKTYDKLIPTIEMRVNGELVERPHNFFEDPKCNIFNIHAKITRRCNANGGEILLIQRTDNNLRCFMYNTEQQKNIGIDNQEYQKLCIDYPIYEGNIQVESTFTLYSDKFNGEEKDTCELPRNLTYIYKNKRLYGTINLRSNTNNGTNNYTLHHVNFTSKKIGKEIGITYNKSISMEVSNDLTKCLRDLINKNTKAFNGDTSTSANHILCESAIEKGIITLDTCPFKKLSQKFRAEIIREKLKEEEEELHLLSVSTSAPVIVQPAPVIVQPAPVRSKPHPVRPKPVLLPDPVLIDDIIPQEITHLQEEKENEEMSKEDEMLRRKEEEDTVYYDTAEEDVAGEDSIFTDIPDMEEVQLTNDIIIPETETNQQQDMTNQIIQLLNETVNDPNKMLSIDKLQKMLLLIVTE